jgi:methionyl-tRNA synthetase
MANGENIPEQTRADSPSRPVQPGHHARADHAERPKFYLTTPIYYVNARPHLGHTYTTVVADTIARYKRMRGYDVVLLTGTDEHGQKVERAAKVARVTPQAYADRISGEYRRLWSELGLRIDRFVRTTDDAHEHAVRRLLEQARDNGFVYKGHYEGEYCVFDEMYVDEPLPGNLCPECHRPTERVREENYYFKLSAFQERLMELYEQQPDFIQPEARRNEVMAFVRGGLRDLSVSRTSVKWGIPWPGDDKHVFYVWYDALTSYMTGVGYGDDELQWEHYWPADLHLIGKEILRFHAVYWPAFLLAAGEPLPKKIFAHGWWLFQEEKMSKSRGNMQHPQPAARVLGTDALRYFLLRDMVFGQDGNYTRDTLLTRYNSDLANGLGNLASRTLTMIEKYFGGEIPERSREIGSPLKSVCAAENQFVLEAYESYGFSSALQHVWQIISLVDNYITNEKPWKLAEIPAERKRLASVLYDAAEALRFIVVLVHPVIPQSTQTIWRQLGLPGAIESQRLDELAWGGLMPGKKIGEFAPVFPRVDHKEAFERMEAMEQKMNEQTNQAGKQESAAAEQKPGGATQASSSGAPTGGAPTAGTPSTSAIGTGATQATPATPVKIGMDDFTKVEMRVGVVQSAEKVAGADKLLKVMVDIGAEVRQVVAGIAEAYKPEDLVGRRVLVVANLSPRKLRGVESNGMILAASVGPEGKPVLCTFAEEVPAGTRLK